jgi:hypothetical protein
MSSMYAFLYSKDALDPLSVFPYSFQHLSSMSRSIGQFESLLASSLSNCRGERERSKESDDKRSIVRTISVLYIYIKKRGSECLQEVFDRYYIAINHQDTFIIKRKDEINLTDVTKFKKR